MLKEIIVKVKRTEYLEFTISEAEGYTLPKTSSEMAKYITGSETTFKDIAEEEWNENNWEEKDIEIVDVEWVDHTKN